VNYNLTNKFVFETTVRMMSLILF